MKKYFFSLMLFGSVIIPCFSQAGGVAIISDSAQTTAYLADQQSKSLLDKIIKTEEAANVVQFYQNVQATLDNASQTLQTISNTYNMMESQVEAIQLMSEGDYVSFVQGLEQQAQAIGYLGQTMNGLNSENFADLRELTGIKSDDLTNLTTSSEMLSKAIYDSTDMLWSGKDVVDNTKRRMDTLQYLNATTSDSNLLGQLQLQNAGVQMMIAEVADLKALTATANIATASWTEAEMQQEQAQKEFDKQWYEWNVEEVTPKISNSEYNDIIFGGVR